MTAQFTGKVVLVTGGGSGIGRVATLDEVAGTITWLASANAAYLVGHDLVADGGASA